jgi:transcriptional regulator of PTS gene
MVDNQKRVKNAGFFTLSGDRVKDYEKEAVFHIIKNSHPVSQKQILGSFSIRPADLSNAIKELLQDGLIQKYPEMTNRYRGRPEIFFQPKHDRLVSLAVYTDSWNFYAIAIDLMGNIIHEDRCSTTPTEHMDELFKKQKDLISRLRTRLSPDSEIMGAGISLPGNVDTEKSLWKESHRWIHVSNLDYKKLGKVLGIPIVLYRDLDAVLLHELTLTPETKDELVILLHWGIGLGMAFAYRGTIVRSNHGRFGTLGYIQFDPRQKNHVYTGILDRQTSLWKLIKVLRRRFPKVAIDEREFADLIHRNDFDDIPEFKNAIEYVGLALRDICTIFYPDRIFLLSPFAENQKILKQIRTAFVSGHLIDDLQKKIPIRPVANGYRGCIYGSTRAIFENGLRKYLKARY